MNSTSTVSMGAGAGNRPATRRCSAAHAYAACLVGGPPVQREGGRRHHPQRRVWPVVVVLVAPVLDQHLGVGEARNGSTARRSSRAPPKSSA